MKHIRESHTQGLKGDKRQFFRDIRKMWHAGYDTADMAWVTQTTEHECERAIHHVLHVRWQVIGRTKVINEPAQ